MTEKLFTMAEAAEYLGISQKTLRGHIMDGEITFILIGRGVVKKRRVFASEDLERFKASRRRREVPITVTPRTRRRVNGTDVLRPMDFTMLRAERRRLREDEAARKLSAKNKPPSVR